MDLCILCYKAFDNDDMVKVTQKGLDTLINHAKIKYDTKVHERLVKKDLLTAAVFVHKTCRKKYTDPRKSLSFDQP